MERARASTNQTFFAGKPFTQGRNDRTSHNATRLYATLPKMALVFGENRPWIELPFLPIPSGKIQVNLNLLFYSVYT